MKTLLKWFTDTFLTTPCPKCLSGRVWHSHSEPLEKTTIEVYECDNCKAKFV